MEGAWQSFAAEVGNLFVPGLLIVIAIWFDRRLARIQTELTDVNVRVARIEGALAAKGLLFSPDDRPAQAKSGAPAAPSSGGAGETGRATA